MFRSPRMIAVLWTGLLLLVAALATGASCLERAEEQAQELVEQAATEVAKQQTVVAEQQAEEASDKDFTLVNGTWPLPWGKEKRLFLDVVEILPPKFYADPAPLDTVERVGIVRRSSLIGSIATWAAYFPEERKIELAAIKAATNFDEDYLRLIYVHELTHVLQAYDPTTGRRYDCIPESDLLNEYGRAVGYVIRRVDCPTGGGDAEDNRDPKEIPPYSDPSDDCAGEVCIWEDMADAVGTYVIEPERLKQLSPTRYDFIRDKVFDGKEY